MPTITTKTRDEIIDDFERNYLNRAPGALTGPGTPVRRDAVLIADALMPVYSNCAKMGRALALDERTEEELRQLADDMSVPLAGASSSSGFVTARAATSGTVIFAGDELIEPSSKLVFYCTTTASYADGGQVSVAARSTGPETNLDAGKVLQWRSPRPGCSTTAVIAEATDGSGLTGGAAADGREQIIEKIRNAKETPPAAGNDADYQKWIRDTPEIQIQEAFIYPCAHGPGTTGWCFTVAPNASGSRIPNEAQVAIVRSYVAAKASKTDISVSLTIVAEAVEIVVGVDWADADAQWANETPWPQYLPIAPSVGSGAIRIGTVTNANTFQLVASNGDYSTCGDPSAGTVLGLFETLEGDRRFIRKTIMAVIGTGPWTIICDQTYGASDNIFVPRTGMRVMPWSDGLAQFIAPVVAHFDAVGPGEVKPPGYLAGQRARRFPESPKRWPGKVTKSLELTLESMGIVESLDMLEGGGQVATVSPNPNLLVLSYLAAFPRP